MKNKGVCSLCEPLNKSTSMFLSQLMAWKRADIYKCASETCVAFEFSIKDGRYCARMNCKYFHQCVECREWYCDHCVVSYGTVAKCKECSEA